MRVNEIVIAEKLKGWDNCFFQIHVKRELGKTSSSHFIDEDGGFKF